MHARSSQGLPPTLFGQSTSSMPGTGSMAHFKRGVTFRARSGIHTLLQEAKEEEASHLARQVSAHSRSLVPSQPSGSLLIRPPNRGSRPDSAASRGSPLAARRLTRVSGNSVLRNRINRITGASGPSTDQSMDYLASSGSRNSIVSGSIGETSQARDRTMTVDASSKSENPEASDPIWRPPTHLNGISPFANQLRRVAMRLHTSFVVVIPRRFQDAERQVLSAYRGSKGIDAAEMVLEGPGNQSRAAGGRRLRSMLLDRDIEAMNGIADEFVLSGPTREQRLAKKLDIGRSKRVSITSLVSPTKSRALRRAIGAADAAQGDDRIATDGESSRPPSPSTSGSRTPSPLSDRSSDSEESHHDVSHNLNFIASVTRRGYDSRAASPRPVARQPSAQRTTKWQKSVRI